MATRERTTRGLEIAELLRIRATAHADLVAAIGGRPDPQWAKDRQDDIDYANRRLVELGAIPADVAL